MQRCPSVMQNEEKHLGCTATIVLVADINSRSLMADTQVKHLGSLRQRPWGPRSFASGYG